MPAGIPPRARFTWATLFAPTLGAAWVALCFRPLLGADRVLSNRDIQLFHLPLRTCFARLARLGFPAWNPWLHGGQPLLSNPSYAAFYPPSWLALVLPVPYAMGLLAVLHAAIAFAGAWFLARRLGAGRGAAALAAIGYTGSGAFLSLLSAFTLFCSMAWFPWVLAWGDSAMREPKRWLRPALLSGMALGLQLLNGEPSTVMMSGLGLLAIALPAILRHPLRLARVALPIGLAIALAAIQLLPTASRVAESPRGGAGLNTGDATLWSAPPARAIELVFPHFYGDPDRDRDGLFFGWGVHDRDYPYIISIYPGLLLSLLAFAGLCRWQIPRRSTWILAILLGIFLALGRHNPLFEPVRAAIPILAALRFPEKFLVLTIAALTVAGALGWQRLIEERRRGQAAAADLPLALAVVVVLTAGSLYAVEILRPAVMVGWIRSHGYPGLDAHGVDLAIAALREEASQAVWTTVAVAVLLLAVRIRRTPERFLQAAAILLVATDLWHYGHSLIHTAPARIDQIPPPFVALVPPGSRVFVEPAPPTPDVVPKLGDPASALDRAQIARLEPFSGVLWHVPYALNDDFDLTLTHWGSLALSVFHAEWLDEPELAERVLGAWNVETMFLRTRPPASTSPPSDAGTHAVYARRNRYRIPRFRFMKEVAFLPTYEETLAAARGDRYRIGRHDYCWRAGRAAATVSYAEVPQVQDVADVGSEVRLRYTARFPSFLVVAVTFDRGWDAATEQKQIAVLPTALGQMGIELPAGQHELVLGFHERWLPLGRDVTLLALAVLTLGLVIRRPAKPEAGDEPPAVATSA